MSQQSKSEVAKALAAYIARAYEVTTSFDAAALGVHESIGNARDEWADYLRAAELDGGYDAEQDKNNEDY